MAASVEKLSVGALLVVLLLALILCSTFAIADQREEIDRLFNADLHATESEDFKVGMPLYRVKDMPNVLIPASLIQSQARHKSGSP
jgi:hypothetical protein